jgi:hypothetical protein
MMRAIARMREGFGAAPPGRENFYRHGIGAAPDAGLEFRDY